MIDRRQALTLASACCMAGLGPLTPRAALAAAPTDRRLVVVLLRGAMDGLAAVPAYGDPAYAAARGSLAMDGNDGLLDLDGFFALHPALVGMHGLYRAGELAVLHAVATPYRERCHFDGQDLLETGGASVGAERTGWLNRALALLPVRDRRLGLAMAPVTPLILRGDAPVMTWAPRVPAEAPVVAAAYGEGLANRHGQGGGTILGTDVGRAGFGRLCREAGDLLKHPEGLRVAAIELGGWDSHQGQGRAEGQLANRLAMLDDGLMALKEALGPVWAETAVIVATEFGRTVAVNGTGGTDHGTASAAFVLGGRVAGGQVMVHWPGLTAERLLEGRDLAPTMDLRAAMMALLVGHLELEATAVASRVLNAGHVGVLKDLLHA
jgi:uncharacterized protein (DUF1501 family)